MVTIIIVNYNLSTEVSACLESLEQELESDSFEVIVVDNGSIDEDFKYLIDLIRTSSSTTLIRSESNIGFGAACNLGVASARGDFLCFLNPDTTVDSDFLQCLLLILNTSNCTMVGPVYSRPGLFEYSSGYFPNLFLETLSIFFVGRHIEAAMISAKRYFNNSFLKVDWILGACMLLSKDDFHQVGGFDEDFFLFYEEVDLCKRISDQGGSIALATNCQINHIGSVSVKKDYIQFTNRFYQGKLRYIYKQTKGMKRTLMLRVVWLQMLFQKALWSFLRILDPEKSNQKIAGFNLALSHFRSIN
ncbi:MAG: glycosyltransferase family 2 protein [bacterium]